MEELLDRLLETGMDDLRVLDISALAQSENRGLSRAVLLVKRLPEAYVRQLNAGETPDKRIFGEVELVLDGAADRLAETLCAAGWRAISQSEANLDARGDYCPETKRTPLPHKKIAVMTGLGWIGKNNLLVTQRFGCAFCMSSVLTDYPFAPRNAPAASPQCGSCRLCQMICPAKAIRGAAWSPAVSRDEIVDVFHCQRCLKCMAGCRLSRVYAGQDKAEARQRNG